MSKNSKGLCRFFFLGFILLFFNGCSSLHKGDGPPNFYVDASKVPDAVPKVEPHSKYGNLPSYRVFGKKYHVMKSSKNYDQIGVASWYGTKFHKQLTSSGESYDMLAMTAAHKTLPLPTYVEVTNLKNKRKIIVKVNDRGPFEAHRIIDLSYVAAKKLGMLGHGTAYVRVKAIDPVQYQYAHRSTYRSPIENLFAYHSTPPPQTQGIYLQVGAFKNRMYAEQLKDRINTRICSRVQISKTQNVYKVQVGPINTMTTADQISRRLKLMGLRAHRVNNTVVVS